MAKGKKTKPILEVGDIQLWVETNQYVVTVKKANIRHYFPGLDYALEGMLDLFERRSLSKTLWRGQRTLLKEVYRLNKQFWTEVDKRKFKRKEK